MSNSLRLQILDELVKGPRTLEDISASTDLKSESILHHIRILQQVGLVEEFEPIRKGGPGRPYSRYRLTGKTVKIQYPQRNYALLAEVLLQRLSELTDPAEMERRLKQIGTTVGKEIAQTVSSKYGLDELSLTGLRENYVEDHLKEMGVQPEVVSFDEKKLQYRQYNCLFLELAKKYPKMICTMSEGVMNGLVSTLTPPSEVTRLKCLTSNDNCCEYLIRLKP